MTATRGDIEAWLARAGQQGAAFVIVACDTFDYDNYPVFIGHRDDFWLEYRRISASSMQRIDEVYDMSRSIPEQLEERRAFHPPSRDIFRRTP